MTRKKLIYLLWYGSMAAVSNVARVLMHFIHRTIYSIMTLSTLAPIIVSVTFVVDVGTSNMRIYFKRSNGYLTCGRSFGLLEHRPRRLSWQFRIKRSSGNIEMGQREHCSIRWWSRRVNRINAFFEINSNVLNFSIGNSFSVTVFGNSAGGASATYLMMSPLAKGLFTKAIAQSGVNFDAWAQPAHKGVSARRATKLAEMLGCGKSDKWGQKIDCLRRASAKDVTAAFYDFFVGSRFWCAKCQIRAEK